MFGRGYSWTDRGLATASFLGGVLSGGWSPNVGLAIRAGRRNKEAERIANARAGRERYEEERRQYYESLGDPARSADAAPQPNEPDTVFDQVVEAAPHVIVATFVPGYGELLDLSVMFGRGYSWTDRGLATVSLVGGVLTGGWSPNIGPAIRATRGSGKPSLRATKEALRQVHKEVGGSLPPGRPGKFGSPQRRTAQKGYRLDPGHPGRPLGDPEVGPHINWWDYTSGKRGAGGRSGAIPIIE